MKLLTIREVEKLFLATVGLQRPTILPSILTRLNPKEPSLETTWLRVLKNSADTRWLQYLPCSGLVSKWQKHLCASYEECRVLSSCCSSFFFLLFFFDYYYCLSVFHKALSVLFLYTTFRALVFGKLEGPRLWNSVLFSLFLFCFCFCFFFF